MIEMTSIIFHSKFTGNASKLCGFGDNLPFVRGTWRDKKMDDTIDSDDNDDGFSKSDGNDSYQSAHETLTTESRSSVSSTSGVSSNENSENAGKNHEIVNKIVISRRINDAIFKPGIFPFSCK